MPESPMVGARVSSDWHRQIQETTTPAGRKEAEVVREALAQYLGKTDPSSVKGAIVDLQERVANLERKLSGLGQLVG